ncbi:MAG: adenylosuccinate lyase [Nitrososphaerota archaeon]|uniref:adenylosuccinate lyase n=1 Tax=Candidatus Bathycorpusculum sp. TaxID=2994959 RepID=UPI00282F80B9|nr:adenylosuccinate lyase [Candidatus Termitimicrobium sp.]MCL2431728.1 adenylosuccinate lyase [Candidatus Termitimicrobium sp.]MDR0492815.1 adenylosuccinate lyase [Nitrososphaerota archaeon]
MPILPIDTRRYGTSELLEIFDEENRLQKLLDVEAALALAHAKVGTIPQTDAQKIAEMASTRYVKVERVKVIEKEIKHDLASMVRALSEQCGSSGAYVHLGATSYDIVDTANALQLKDALSVIGKKLVEFKGVLQNQAGVYKATVMIGRTHGQHALPITLGFKFAVWGYEVSRHLQRLDECKKRVLAGKISGAVGTQASLGEHASEIQALVMERLGLSVAEISTQIVQRDRYAELIGLYALVASSLENFATEIRELQRPEIAEVFESFEAKKQVGSSTMPHKQNPEICERVCGLARIVRSLELPALENMVTWHERDLTQSSAERFILPQSSILLDYILSLMINLIANLRVDSHRMLQNLSITGGRSMSESVMMALVKKGVNRQQAHELLRQLTIKSTTESKPFKQVLLEDPFVSRQLTETEIDTALDPKNYLGTAIQQAEHFAKSP